MFGGNLIHLALAEAKNINLLVGVPPGRGQGVDIEELTLRIFG